MEVEFYWFEFQNEAGLCFFGTLKPSFEPKGCKGKWHQEFFQPPSYECIMSFLQNENPGKSENRKLFYGNSTNPSFGMQILFPVIIHISPFLHEVGSGKRVRNERCVIIVLKVEIWSKGVLCHICGDFLRNVEALLWF